MQRILERMSQWESFIDVVNQLRHIIERQTAAETRDRRGPKEANRQTCSTSDGPGLARSAIELAGWAGEMGYNLRHWASKASLQAPADRHVGQGMRAIRRSFDRGERRATAVGKGCAMRRILDEPMFGSWRPRGLVLIALWRLRRGLPPRAAPTKPKPPTAPAEAAAEEAKPAEKEKADKAGRQGRTKKKAFARRAAWLSAGRSHGRDGRARTADVSAWARRSSRSSPRIRRG